VLGGFPDTTFDQDSIALHTGDRLLLFTDGVTEAVNRNGDQFGEERLIELLRNNKERSSEGLKEILFKAVGQFCEETFEDDAALMVVAVN
jgi:sigma-B regulation protein RsbU (phosphoserine phosphatase)